MNLNLMRRIASKSPHVKYQHCTLIFVGNRLISYGYNRANAHAEIVALNRARAVFRNQKKIPSNLHMVNFMIKRKNGNLGNSYPCDKCYIHAILMGVRTITCFGDDGKPHQLGGML